MYSFSFADRIETTAIHTMIDVQTLTQKEGQNSNNVYVGLP